MKSVLKSLLLVVLVISAFGGGAPAAAQQARDEGGAKNDIEAEWQALFQAIEEKKAEIERIEGDITAASGDDREAFERRIAELAPELIDDVQALAAQVVAWEEQGQDASAYRDQVADMLRRVASFIRRAIERLDTEMDSLAARHQDAAPEEVVEIEDRHVVLDERLNYALSEMVDQLEAMDGFGLDTVAEREFLESFLQERAALLAGRIKLAREELTALERRTGASPDDAGLAAEFELEQQRLDGQVANLYATARMMESLELDTADYRQLLFEETGEVTIGLMSGDVIGGLLSTWTGNTVGWITTSGPKIFFKTILFLLILVVFRIFSWISRKVVRKAIQTSSLKVSKLLERTALSVTGAAVMIFGVLVALSQFGFEVGPLLAGLGVVGFIIGFALQDTLGNFAAGVMILLYRPYDVGDLIEVAGGTGKVHDMTLVSTTILTLDHRTLVIPNNKIWGDVIQNVTAQKERRIDMIFGISYSDDIPHAERVLKEILEAHEQVLDDPESMVKLHNLGESSVDFIVRPWAKTENYWDVYWDVTREVKIRFDAEGISIPFPQRDVHVIEEKATESA
jgi:small conductance mechanosensitive channel